MCARFKACGCGLQVLEMLEKGQTPPGIRDDINDKPPNPSQPPPAARAQPRPKPWESIQGRQEPAGLAPANLGFNA